jgi:hypothetical protein
VYYASSWIRARSAGAEPGGRFAETPVAVDLVNQRQKRHASRSREDATGSLGADGRVKLAAMNYGLSRLSAAGTWSRRRRSGGSREEGQRQYGFGLSVNVSVNTVMT